MSVRPSDFAKIVDQLAAENLLNEDKYWRRVLIEKPFGTDLKSAIELQKSISQHLKELKQLGLIKGNVEGTSVCYCIHTENWTKMKATMLQFLNQDIASIENCC